MKCSAAQSCFTVTVGVLLLLATGCSATSELDKHPANKQIQHDVTEIVKAVHEESGAALYASLKRLVAYDVFAVEQVSELAKDPNARLRSNALWVLAQIHDPDYPHIDAEIDGLLRHGLEDPELSVRYEAAAGLAARNQWDVLPILINGLEEQDSGVRFRCHEQLIATTSRDFGYMVDAPDEVRKQAVERWRHWFADWQHARV